MSILKLIRFNAHDEEEMNRDYAENQAKRENSIFHKGDCQDNE